VTGAAGTATLTKLAINHILALNRLALAEGLVFAETIGLDKADFLEIARMSAAYSQVMDTKGDKMDDSINAFVCCGSGDGIDIGCRDVSHGRRRAPTVADGGAWLSMRPQRAAGTAGV
jgi:hypothetical protein